MLRDFLGLEGIPVGRRHVSTLMRTMGIEALYRRPNTSRPQLGHPVFPYLLRGLAINRASRSGPWISYDSDAQSLRIPGGGTWIGRPGGYCPGGCPTA